MIEEHPDYDKHIENISWPISDIDCNGRDLTISIDITETSGKVNVHLNITEKNPSRYDKILGSCSISVNIETIDDIDQNRDHIISEARQIVEDQL